MARERKRRGLRRLIPTEVAAWVGSPYDLKGTSLHIVEYTDLHFAYTAGRVMHRP